VKSFPIGKEWMYEPKWDGFRCLVFRDEENIFLQSRTGKSLTSAFPESSRLFKLLVRRGLSWMANWLYRQKRVFPLMA
jgi:ATP-dependent DNA ligase